MGTVKSQRDVPCYKGIGVRHTLLMIPEGIGVRRALYTIEAFVMHRMYACKIKDREFVSVGF